MDADRVADVFAEACARSPGAQRAAFLTDACGGDESLRAEVDSLLLCQETASGFLDEPVFEAGAELLAEAAASAANGELKAGDLLGVYEVRSLIGIGGMGEVYLALDTALGRQVALKLILRGAAGALARHFHHERRVLAALTHPHIARLYDSGVTPEGRAYLVMEYVEGERLDTYCAAHALSVDQRLALFRKICAGVAYAHQCLVVHRDLKPANIRVTAEGEPKLLDFGIAKLLEAETDSEALPGEATLTMQAMMTPEYASPEQLRGGQITTASDVYSLGVVLYELLAGQRPFQLKNRGLAESARMICEQEPERPSIVVKRRKAETSLPTGTETSAVRLPPSAFLDEDLDKIVAMAMRKEPVRRYMSVSQFSEDIRRYVEGLPVTARKDTPGYRAGKFVRRNKTLVAAAVLVTLALVGGLAGTAWQARRANRRFNDVRRLANSILYEVEPQIANLPGGTAGRNTLIKRAVEYLDRLSQEAGGNLELRRELADAYVKIGDVQGNPDLSNIGDIKGAETSYRKALALRQSLAAADPGSAQARHQLATAEEKIGRLFWWGDQIDPAVAHYRTALALRRALLAGQPRSVEFRQGFASVQMSLGEAASWTAHTTEALADYQQALEVLQGLAREQPNDVEAQLRYARCLSRIGETQTRAGSYDAASATFAQANEVFEPISRREPDRFPARVAHWFNMYSECGNFVQQNATEKALAACPQMVALAEELARKDPQNTTAQHNLADGRSTFGEALLQAQRWQEALEQFQKGLAIDAALEEKSPENSDYADSMGDFHVKMGQMRQHLDQLPEAAADEREAVNILEVSIAKAPLNALSRRSLVQAFMTQGEMCGQQGQTEEARQFFQRARTELEALVAKNIASPEDMAELAALRTRLAGSHPGS